MRFKCLQYSWDDITQLCKILAQKIKVSGFKADTIVAIARGGWVPARILCDHLDIKDLFSVKTEHWGVVATITGKARITQPLNINLENKNILIVDDVADTGDTILLVKEHVLGLSPLEVRTAVLDYKKTSKFEPDYYASKLEEWRWIIYPWSLKEDLKDLLRKENVKSVNEAIKILREYEVSVDKETVKDIIENL
ncbi:xanthine phosphoribosyltransferase [Archaeoglobales archaeon ex4484_92]|nr:MAG: xanthine phosphoribosyltransferase [Archaeoglobales archaeon ex4484_92]